VLWGSNARAAHPIFFHHLLRGLDRGTRLWCIDPRRTASARFADVWLGIDVGSDVALANAIGWEIIHAGLVDTAFVERATTGFEAYAESVEAYTPEHAAALAGVPPHAIRELAHAYATAERAQIVWTLGITEHHHAVDNVLALCNLALLTGHVGRWGSGLVPLRGQNNVQGGGDMGALPDRLPGFARVADPAARARFEAVYGRPLNPEPGLHLTLMFEAMERGDLRALYVIGENPADSEADVEHARALLRELDTLVVQDVFLTRTAELADVVLPAALAWAETEGTVTSSERRVQRVRAALRPPGEARDDLAIMCELARRLGTDLGDPTAEELWDELRTLSANHAGMSWVRLEAEGGLQWPCPAEDHPGSPFLHAWLWADDLEGHEPAPFSVVEHRGPAEALSEGYPLRLTTGRALDSYNTGVQSSRYDSPIRSGSALDMNADDLAAIGLVDGDRALVSSPRGAVEMVVRVDAGLPRGLAFTTFHFPELADVNRLTNDAWDPRSGTAEFKAAAIRVEPIRG
jgi:formate dehydrogenase major subunit